MLLNLLNHSNHCVVLFNSQRKWERQFSPGTIGHLQLSWFISFLCIYWGSTEIKGLNKGAISALIKSQWYLVNYFQSCFGNPLRHVFFGFFSVSKLWLFGSFLNVTQTSTHFGKVNSRHGRYTIFPAWLILIISVLSFENSFISHFTC